MFISSNAFAWRESNGGNGASAEIAAVTSFLVQDLKRIPVLTNTFDFSTIDNQPINLSAWNQASTIGKETLILGNLFPKMDATTIHEMILVNREIESRHMNTSYPLDLELTEAIKACNSNRFLNAFQLVRDSKYILKTSGENLESTVLESQCTNLEFNETSLKAESPMAPYTLSPLLKGNYLYVESIVLKDMAKIPFLKYTYLDCGTCASPDRNVSLRKNLKLRGVKVDAYTTEKITSITTHLDVNAWDALTDHQKYLLTLHETIHYVINLDINYVRSQKVLRLIERYKKLKAFYSNADDFITQALSDNLKTCDTTAFKENYALLGGAAYLFKMNGVKIKNAVNASKCSSIISALPQLNSAEL
jgi:hypothetical protein